MFASNAVVLLSSGRSSCKKVALRKRCVGVGLPEVAGAVTCTFAACTPPPHRLHPFVLFQIVSLKDIIVGQNFKIFKLFIAKIFVSNIRFVSV